jgi:hypothetical protein
VERNNEPVVDQLFLLASGGFFIGICFGDLAAVAQESEVVA